MQQFAHFDVKTVQEAVSLLKQYEGKAKVVAGGTDLYHLMKQRALPSEGPWGLAYPQIIVNLKTIQGLNYIREESSGLKLGAMTTLRDIERSSLVRDKWPALWQAVRAISTPTLRTMGTIGGNIAQEVRCGFYRLADNYFFCLRKGGHVCYAIQGDNRWLFSVMGGPKGCYATHAGDTPTALMALNASVRIAGAGGEKTASIEEFFDVLSPGVKLTPTDLITEIQIPPQPAGSKSAFTKFKVRPIIDFAVSNAAALITKQAGNVSDARVVLGGVYQTPIRSKDAETVLKGKSVNEIVANEAAAAALKGATPLKYNAFKVDIAKTIVRRAILAAAS